MSVLSCNRYNCENIMCDCYIPDIGYICNQCIGEFKQFVSNQEICSEHDLKNSIRGFMLLGREDIIRPSQNIDIKQLKQKRR